MVVIFSIWKIIEEFEKCHAENPIRKFFGECTELKVKLDHCFRQEVSIVTFFSFSATFPSRHDQIFLYQYRKQSKEKLILKKVRSLKKDYKLTKKRWLRKNLKNKQPDDYKNHKLIRETIWEKLVLKII